MNHTLLLLSHQFFAFKDLTAMEAQMAELEEEQRKLKQIQSDIEVSSCPKLL